jgi:hypothetical protein
MVVHADAGADRGHAAAIKVDGQADVGFAGAALNGSWIPLSERCQQLVAGS